MSMTMATPTSCTTASCPTASKIRPVWPRPTVPRALCQALLDAVAGNDEVDAAVDYAQHIPLRVIVGMLGFPQEDADVFRRFIRMVLEDVDLPAEDREAQVEEGELEAYIDARIAEHQAHPQDDLTTFLLNAELDGNR